MSSTPSGAAAVTEAIELLHSTAEDSAAKLLALQQGLVKDIEAKTANKPKGIDPLLLATGAGPKLPARKVPFGRATSGPSGKIQEIRRKSKALSKS